MKKLSRQAAEAKIASLPVWAQEYIAGLKREREVAVRELNEYCDATTPSPFYTDEMVCTGETIGPSTKRRYIQAHTIRVEHAGVGLDVRTFDRKYITLQWGSITGRMSDTVGLVPKAFQCADLVAKENL